MSTKDLTILLREVRKMIIITSIRYGGWVKYEEIKVTEDGNISFEFTGAGFANSLLIPMCLSAEEKVILSSTIEDDVKGLVSPIIKGVVKMSNKLNL